MNKKELIKECMRVMATPKVERWYHDNLETKNQGESLARLREAIKNNELELHEALTLSFVIGMEFNVKFEGVP